MIQTESSKTSSGTLPIEKPRSVDVAAIEMELTNLWKPISPGGSDEHKPVVRACSANLVVVADDIAIIQHLEPVLDEITAEHPARVFLVLSERNSASPMLDAWISARCSLPVPGSSQVCCEQINLAAQGTDIDKIPSVITSLLLPDVPAILLWNSRIDQHDNILPRLVEIADRVIIDSSIDRTPLASLSFWLSSINRLSRRTSFADLSWSAGERWRYALAELFDPQEMIQSLKEIDHIEISYSVARLPHRTGLASSLLLTGWLASRLQWTPLRTVSGAPGSTTATVRSGEHAIRILWKERQDTLHTTGSMTNVTIHCASGVEVSIEQKVDNRCLAITTRSRSGQVSNDLLPRETTSSATMLGKELDGLYRDNLYESALSALVKVIVGRTS